MQSSTKVGIVYIGKAAGKHKFSLLDENDIALIKKFKFEAKVEIDCDGIGAKIFAIAYDVGKDKQHGSCFKLHEYIWEKRCGGIAPGYKVVHKNGITVDNRLCNLMLVCTERRRKRLKVDTSEKSTSSPSEQTAETSFYWMALSKLPPFSPEDEEYMKKMYRRHYNANGEIVQDDEDESASFYECHYSPCWKMEAEFWEFSMCGRCRQARYCGPQCQQYDWPFHKQECKEIAKRRLTESIPDR